MRAAGRPTVLGATPPRLDACHLQEPAEEWHLEGIFSNKLPGLCLASAASSKGGYSILAASSNKTDLRVFNTLGRCGEGASQPGSHSTQCSKGSSLARSLRVASGPQPVLFRPTCSCVWQCNSLQPFMQAAGPDGHGRPEQLHGHRQSGRTLGGGRHLHLRCQGVTTATRFGVLDSAAVGVLPHSALLFGCLIRTPAKVQPHTLTASRGCSCTRFSLIGRAGSRASSWA